MGAIWIEFLRLFDMRCLNSKSSMAVVLAIVITLAVRLTVFDDDCNLLVVGMTFLAAFAVVYILMWIIRQIRDGR